MNTEELVDSFAKHLQSLGGAHFDKFENRRCAKPEAARAEAVVFSILQQLGLSPEIAESTSDGGPDFRCRAPDGATFFVEASCFDEVSVTDRTCVPNCIDGKVRIFKSAPKKIAQKAANKHKQFKKHSLTGVLAVYSSHVASFAVTDSHIATDCFAPNSGITIERHADGTRQGVPYTDFHCSAFLQMENDNTVTPINCSISAILLCSDLGTSTAVCCAEHPSPAHPLRNDWLGPIPVVRLEWPHTEDSEWVRFNFNWSDGADGQHQAIFEYRPLVGARGD